MISLDQFRSTYDVTETGFSFSDHHYTFFVPTTLEPFLNPEDLMDNFPLWAKIWEATAILVHRLSRIPVEPGKRFLEIGAGIGVAGLCATAMGHAVTITEYNPDALAFARANAARNSIPNPDIQELDWHAPKVSGTFDYIIGSEIVFKEEDIPSLAFLFQRYLKPNGAIILAEGMRKTSLKFIKTMENDYRISMKRHTIRSDNKDIPVVLFEMTKKA